MTRVGFAIPGEEDHRPPATYEASVVEDRPGQPVLKQSTSGGPATTAAWLRALADEIDPPKAARPVTRRSGPG